MSVFPHASFAQDTRPIVRVIYFVPRDRQSEPDINAKADGVMKQVQQHYTDEMARLGYKKTIKLEIGANGKVVVHHVKGKSNDAHYRFDTYLTISEEISERYDTSKAVYCIVANIAEGIGRPGRGPLCGSGGRFALVTDVCFTAPGGVLVVAHELGHVFGLNHDFTNDTYLMSYGSYSGNLSPCDAEWLDVHRAFNSSRPTGNEQPTFEMLSLSLAAPPNAIRFRFKVRDPEGLLQARLHTRTLTGAAAGSPEIVSCKRLAGSSNTIAELVTTHLGSRNKSVSLQVIDMNGNFRMSKEFPVNIASVLPRARVVSIPDVSLAGAIRQEIGSSITTHTIAYLTHLDARNHGIKNLKGLEHATNLTVLNLSHNAISDVSPLSNLTQLTWLGLNDNAIWDVSPLSGMTQLTELRLNNNARIWDVSPLSGMTQLTELRLDNNRISDVSPLSNLTQLISLDLRGNLLSYASIKTHIPVMLAKGVNVRYGNRAFPTLVKVSGDGQEATVGETLPRPFIVEVQDERGKPRSGVTVTFAVTTGAGRLSSTTATTNTKGRARTILTLGQRQGKQTVQVTTGATYVPVTFTAKAGVPPIYWIDKNRGTLHRYRRNRVENLVPGIQNVTDIAVDVADGTLYWTEQISNKTGKIQRADLDGSNPRLIKPLMSVPRNLVIDPANSKLYITNLRRGKVQRMNVDGSGFQPNLITELEAPQHLTLTNDKVYWTEQTGEETWKIHRANLDGTNVASVKVLKSMPLGMAADTANGKLYLTNVRGKIQRLNLDGSNYEPNFITGLDSPESIAVDMAGGKLYWADTSSIKCVSLSGESIENIVTGLGTPADFVLGISSSMGAAAPLNVLLPTSQLANPDRTNLFTNYPNPFNPETWIPYQLVEPANVTVHIYAVNGVLVHRLELGYQPAGMYQQRSRAAYWDGKNSLGESVASGMYFYTLTAGDFTATRKMLIRK